MKTLPEIRECDGVYPPREDSYLLLKSIEVEGGERFLDVGTGTGIIGIAAAMEGAEVYIADINENALRCALENAKINGVVIEPLRANILDGIKGPFDIVAFNPPYLPETGVQYELREAIESPEGGSEHIKRFFSAAHKVLKEGGKAYCVVSSLSKIDFENTGYMQKIAEKSLFFERLYVFMLSHKKDL